MGTMKVELSLYAHDLPNVAGAFKGTSDPYAVVTHMPSQPGVGPVVLGKTEVVKNTLGPQWSKVFVIDDFELGMPYVVAVNVVDEVTKGDNKPMGSAIFNIGEVLGSRGNVKAKRLREGGTLFAHVRKSVGAGVFRLQMRGIKLKNVEGFFGKSDPFYEISRRIDSAGAATWDNVFRSPVVRENLNPNWDAAAIPLSTLCGGDLDLPLLFTVYDHEKSGKHVVMGSFETTVRQLGESSTQGADDMDKAIQLTKKGKDTGKILVMRATVSGMPQDQGDQNEEAEAEPPEEEEEEEVEVAVASERIADFPPRKPTFVDYVSGGCELNVVVAIDFTGSNGNPREPGTLHYLDPDGKNDYEKAIASILGILQNYDSDKNYPVHGFGAKYDGVVNHCFQCGSEPEAHGVQGVLDAYRAVFYSGLIMSGPTVFTEVIETAAARAVSSQENAQSDGKQCYTILLIVSDGAVSDAEATASALDAVSDAPLSVVIVGVGDADFSAMEFLDDDATKPGNRDIAQFVQFNRHRSSSSDLTSVTLREIPNQLVGYFRTRDIPPLPPVVVEEEEIVVEDEEEEIDLSLDITDEEIVVTGGDKVYGSGGF